jgi:CRP-like cAMP-binding protein
MDDKQRAYYLSKMRKVLIFRYLEDGALIRILQISNIISYKKNDYIISEGETSPYLFAVLEGSINVSVKKEEGKDIFICMIGEGEVFGEAGIFLTVKRTANVISTENTTILRIHRKDLLDFIKQQPTAGIKLLMIIIYSLLKKLRDANQELAFERKADIEQEDIDLIVQNLMKE